ncbi:MAG TPA: hypothetical protein VJ813_18730 [Vicinamibacterales bacterium]|nr:hypothetical protein [Vicinamibacterales bacterium]
MPALYLTIWIALLLFAAAETGRAFAVRGSTPPGWAWWAFTLGLALALIHTLLSFHIVHDWDHADAVRSTALQTQATYGVPAGWGVYVNYAFFAVWLADAWWWRAAPRAVRPPAVTWTLRAFYMIVIFNAAVVFAIGPRRILGLVLVSWLARVWGQPATTAPSSPRR